MDVMLKPKPDVTTAHPLLNNNLTAQAVNDKTCKKTNGPSKLDKALSIIAKESGILIPEMKNEDFLGDLGIDSLLILVIASRFREELSLDLASSSMEVNTIGSVRAYFKNDDSALVDNGLSTDATSSDSASPGTSSPSSVSEDSDADGAQKRPVSTSILL